MIMAGTLRDNTEHHRYEMDVDGVTASIHYRMTEPGVIDLVHTVVPDALAGRGVGSTLVRAVLDDVRRRGLKVIPTCPFVRGFLGKHPEYGDLVR
jgi:predicted GNAT family acetyltransferase